MKMINLIGSSYSLKEDILLHKSANTLKIAQRMYTIQIDPIY